MTVPHHRHGSRAEHHGQVRAAAGRWRGLLIAACLGLSPLATQAGDTAQATAPAGDARMDAILDELKAIRQVLEKIERQGQGGAAARPAKPTTATVPIGGKPVMGSDTAPVTVVEFTDYQCPYCLRFAKSTFPMLKKEYIDTGKVRWVALNLPLEFHKDARKAAQAAHCAGEQGRFWEMRLTLFEHPQELGEMQLPAHAEHIGLDVDAFRHCLASERHLDAIDQDAEDANAVRLTGTPSFVVGRTDGDSVTGKVIIGAQPAKVFTTAIDDLLEGQDKPAPAAAGKAAVGGS